jgi:hypothetical protein
MNVKLLMRNDAAMWAKENWYFMTVLQRQLPPGKTTNI